MYTYIQSRFYRSPEVGWLEWQGWGVGWDVRSMRWVLKHFAFAYCFFHCNLHPRVAAHLPPP